jgi:phage baseplate assembly protein W
VAIKIQNLKNIADQFAVKQYVFKDLHLDFAKEYNYDQSSHTKISTNDLQVDYDLKAITNSLKNLFNTRPGQRFLFPKYGLDLNQFLFEPITRVNAQAIGESIVRSVDEFEPRVQITNCKVTPVPDDNEYFIQLSMEFPIFNTQFTLDGTLNTTAQTFIVADTSRTR